ncbi:DUF1232 domain-containing protein [Candidatus Woesearchaeota archaeon]|nr:DUF1232 domain-containing protein [Candidatus Woesearchaeota archaeon]
MMITERTCGLCGREKELFSLGEKNLCMSCCAKVDERQQKTSIKEKKVMDGVVIADFSTEDDAGSLKIRNKKDFRGFYEDLKEAVSINGGEHHNILIYCPEFFKLLCNILIDDNSDWNTKILINCALAYFVLPEDVIPEHKYGAEGYIDDLFLCSYVLKEIKDNIDEGLITKNWEGNEDIVELIDDIYSKSKILISEHYLKILRLVGLRKYSSLDLDERQSDYPRRIARLADEKRELLGLLSFLVSKIYGQPRLRQAEQLKQFIEQHEDYGEIQRIISIAKGERGFNKIKQPEKSFEDRIRENKVRGLLKDKTCH